MKITSEQAKELISLVQQAEIPAVFEQLRELGLNSPDLNALEREFIFGKYTHEFYDRLQVYIKSMTVSNTIAMVQPKYDVFIGYSHQNQSEVEQLVQILREQNLSVFFFEHSLQMELEKVNLALKNSTHFVFYCTTEAIQTQEVEREYSIFFKEAHSKSPSTRKLLILEGINFHGELVPDLLKDVPTFKEVKDILIALGKMSPEESNKIRKEEYYELYKAFYNDGLITEKERNILRKHQLNLHLTDVQIASVEEACQKEAQEKKNTALSTPQAAHVQNNKLTRTATPIQQPQNTPKKYNPLIFVGGGVAAVILILFFVFTFNNNKASDEEYNTTEDASNTNITQTNPQTGETPYNETEYPEPQEQIDGNYSSDTSPTPTQEQIPYHLFGTYDCYDCQGPYSIIVDNGIVTPEGYSESFQITDIIQDNQYLKYSLTGNNGSGTLYIDANQAIFTGQSGEVNHFAKRQ